MTVPSHAHLELPSWFWGGSSAAYFDRAELRGVQQPGGATNPAMTRWGIRTTESHRRIKPSLIHVENLAGPGARVERLDRLRDLALKNSDTGLSERTRAHPALATEAARLERRAETESSLVAGFMLQKLNTSLADTDELPDVVRALWRGHQDATFTDDPTAQVFPHAGVHVMWRAPAFLDRVYLPSVLLRVANDPALGDPARIAELSRSAAGVFASSRELSNGLLVFDAYLGPLLGALSPHVWAFVVERRLGSIIYSLGTALPGARPSGAELLDLIGHSGADSMPAAAEIPADAASAAISWWGNRLNMMFGVLTDPAVFAGRGGDYLPSKHLQALLTVEQLFRRVTSMQTSWRDGHARRVLLFTILDTIERLTGRNLEYLCSLRRAQEVLDRLENSVPAAAQPILLPSARRAVDALRNLQDGFFLRTDAEKAAGTVTLERSSAGTNDEISIDAAAAYYVKVLRNATHGHGDVKLATRTRTEALLALHDGTVSHDLPLLGYLHLLDVLDRGEKLRPVLWRGGAP